ncbi:nuclear transport factor 2 family protein [Leptolyngbya ohadii]|uniref:nuclear transport factor 2 family protein n=1 Tax=Leptolyngbya ohadii TaxID=1962290 RepID=UPI000B599587|nr:nuclear transport factor 2 family protein [Leptolyngbya ohadii]
MNISRRNLTWLGGTGFLVTLFANPTPTNAQRDTTPGTSNDQAAIINAVNGIAIFADLRDWERCRQSFTDEVEFDYTAMLGGQPTVITADQQMQQWSTFFDSTFKNTQHILGSHVVTIDGNQATCVSNFQAHHTYLNPELGVWVLSGVYNHDLTRVGNQWKVNRMKMTIAWEMGNRPG